MDVSSARAGIGMFAAIAVIHLTLNVWSKRARKVWWMVRAVTYSGVSLRISQTVTSHAVPGASPINCPPVRASG